MKIRIILIVALLVIIVPLTHAQNYTFKVLASNGQSLIKSGKKDWEKIKTGAKLYSNDDVKILEGGYLGLVHISGKTMELKEASIYNVSKLSSKLLANSQSMVSKYADYVISKMTPEYKEENRRLYASVTGSVERGIFDSEIFIYLPKTVSVINNKSIIRWSSKLSKPIFTITIKNIFGEVIQVGETSGNTFLLDFNDKNMNEGMISNLLIIDVAQKSNTAVVSQSVSVRKIDKLEVQELIAALDQLKGNVGKESSLNYLILAEFYEENELTLDAITSYENSIKLSPEVKYFQEVYDEFLIRNGLKSPADVDSEEE